jgi:hypothetical protein
MCTCLAIISNATLMDTPLFLKQLCKMWRKNVCSNNASGGPTHGMIHCLVLIEVTTYRRSRGIRNTSCHISFEFLFIKTCPPDKLHNDSVSSFNSASESVM